MTPTRRSPARVRLLALATSLVAGLSAFVVTAPSAGAVHPPTLSPGSEIEVYAPYQGQTLCDPVAKKGVKKFRAMVLATYGGTGDSGITRACDNGGRSEHKEGRAWDWAADVNNERQVKQVHALFDWLFATDKYGNTDAMARRLGIMYMIWNKRIWNAGRGWSDYSCSGYTACHKNHVHFSFGWAGAKARTSYWTGEVSPVIDPPKVLIKDSQLPKTVTVDPRSDVKTKSWFKLREGHQYKISVTGTYTYGYGDGISLFGPQTADAECSGQPSQLLPGTFDWLPTSPFAATAGESHLDLKAMGSTEWEPAEDNGHGCAAGSKHKYRMTVQMPKTKALVFKVLDDNYEDNWGLLTVKVSDA